MAIDLNSREDLEGWLEEQPLEIVVGTAARAALRVFPLFGLLEFREKYVNAVLLPLLRGLALSWIGATYPTHDKDLIFSTVASDVAVPARRASAAAVIDYINLGGDILTVVDAAARAASYAADAVYIANRKTGAIIRLRIPDVIRAAVDTSDAAYAAANISANFDVDEKFKMNAPLWASEQGNEVPAEILEHWQKLKTRLLGLDQNWQVWTDWYEARLWPDKFPTPNEQLEVDRALISEDIWQQGWQAVNPEIERLMAEHLPDDESDLPDGGEVEPQNTAAPVFISGENGIIDIDTRAGSNDLLDDDEARDRHGEALRLAQGFVNGFDRDEPGANQATGLLEDIRHYIEPLGSSIEDIRPGLLITRGDGLRQILNLQKNRDDFSTLPEISDKHLLELGKLVAAHNYLVGLDPALAKRDEVLLGPDAQRNLVAPLEGQQVIHVAVEIGLAAPAVEEIMQEEADIAPQQPDAESRVSRRYSEGIKNFARVALGQAKALGQLAWRHKGKITAGGLYGAAQWVMAHEAWLLKTFADNPHMLDMIVKLLEMLRKLPL